MFGYGMVGSVSLFVLGALLGHQCVLPLLVRFIIADMPVDVTLMPELSHTMDWSMGVMMAMGLAFQLPLVMAIAARLGGLTPKRVRAWRAYVVVMALVIGMMVTPPDVLSQLCFAIPLCLLYEVGALMVWIMHRRHHHAS